MIIFTVAYIIPKTKEKGKYTTAFFLVFFYNILSFTLYFAHAYARNALQATKPRFIKPHKRLALTIS
jgi:hypothetical protein